MAQQIKKKFIKNDAIDGSKIKLLEGESIRIDSPAGEIELLKLGENGELISDGKEVAFKSQIDAEAEARESGDQSLQSAIDSEESRAMLEESRIDGKVDQEISDRQEAISQVEQSLASEVSARQLADLVLQGNIDSEAFAREAADLVLQANVDDEESARISGDTSAIAESKSYTDEKISLVMSNLDTEALDSLVEVVTAFQNADSDINQAITNLAASASSALEAEVLARQSADQSLQSSIDSEESARVAADLLLQGNIDAEVLARISADDAIDIRLDSLESFGYDQLIYVSKNGLDTNTGKQHFPFLTISAALNAIADASPSKRYIIKVAPGNYTESSLSLKANVFVVGEGQKESVRITGAVSMNSSFSGSGDHRSGFSNVTLLSAADFNWQTVTSAAGKLYFNEVVFASTLNMYGHNNAIAQAQFNACVIFGAFTISGINVGIFTNNVCYGNVTLSQHPNGGMATILVATGGYCNNLTQTTTVNDFNRRCATFLRGFECEKLILDGPASYADVDLVSQGKQTPDVLNGANLVALNPRINHDLTTKMIKPVATNAHNMGDWGNQWFWNFGYVHASTGTDLFLISYGESYGADTTGRNIGIIADGAGLAQDVNGGNVSISTAATTGTGVRGKVVLDGREIDLTNKQIKNLADGTDSKDAINKGQLEVEQTARQSADDALGARLIVLEADPVTKSFVESEVSALESSISATNGILTQEISNRVSGDADLQSQIDSLVGSDASLQSQIDTEKGRIDVILSGSEIDKDSFKEIVALINSVDTENDTAFGSYVVSNNAALAQEISDRQADVDAEEVRALAAEADLQSKIDAEESRAMSAESALDVRLTSAEGDINSLEARVTENESDISVLQSQVLNVESDVSSLKTRMTTAESDISSLETAITSEVSRAQSAEEALDARVDVLEARAFGKQKVVIGQELSFIELEREVVANSLVVCVNRLSVHKDEDYTVSVVGGKTRLTWINSFANPDGEEKIEEGDNIFVTFYY